MNIYRLCCVLLLGLLSSGSRGETIADLYVAQVPVAGQGAEERATGIRQTFAQVLVKVSGDPTLPGKSAVSKELDRANNYVQQYRYLALDTPAATRTDDQAGAADRLLWVKFDETAVNRLLRDRGIPVWGSTRPATLIWLGLESEGQRSLFQAESESDLREGLEEVARSRGLPLLFPLMDLEDQRNLQASDVWGVFEETVRRASERYQPDVILVGRLRQRGSDDWLADWTLYQPDGMKNWQSTGKTRSGAAQEGLQQAVHNLAARYAPATVARGEASLQLRVTGLHHLADYLLVKDYLLSLDVIQALDLLAATPDEVSFLVRVQGGREVLERSVMLSRVLEPIGPQEPAGGAASAQTERLDAESLNYRLRQ